MSAFMWTKGGQCLKCWCISSKASIFGLVGWDGISEILSSGARSCVRSAVSSDETFPANSAEASSWIHNAGEAPSRSQSTSKNDPSFDALHRHPLMHHGSILFIESPTKTTLISLPTSIDPNTPHVRANRRPSYFHHTYPISVRDTETLQSFATVLCRVLKILNRPASCFIQVENAENHQPTGQYMYIGSQELPIVSFKRLRTR